ncbi:MAG: hypothetical protein ABW115_17680 [Candidatus Thiodiazotropha sp. 6PLUC6]
MTRVTLFRLLPAVLFLLVCASANAVEMRQNFTLTGTNGETGSGFFTWDDAVILDGSILPLGSVISGSLTVTGGTTTGGTQTFALADWTVGILRLTPDFAVDLNISANNGVTTLAIFNTYETDASWGSRLTLIPGATVLANPPANPRAIPLLDSPGLIIISLLLALTGLWQVKRQSSKRS